MGFGENLSAQAKGNTMNITKIYYTFVLSKNFGIAFTFASFVPFLLSIGLTYAEVALVNFVFAGVVFLAELPTGMLADGKSRAWSLRAGTWFWILGASIYLCANGFWIAALADGVLAIGSAFLSGARQAWITDALARYGRSGELRQVFAKEAIFRGIACVIGGTLGVFLSTIHLRLIWIPAIIGPIISLVIAYRYINGDGEPIERVSEKEAFTKSVNLLRRTPSLLWVLVLLIVFGGVMAFNHYWTPYFEEIASREFIALLWPIIYGSTIVAGFIMHRVKVRAGQEGNLILLGLFLTGFSLVLVPFVPTLSLIVFLIAIHEFGRGIFSVAVESFVQHRVESSYRATFGSLQSFISHIGLALVPLIVWFALSGKPNTPQTIELLWLIAGGVMASAALIFFFLKPKDVCLLKEE
jgi:MFS family permease